MAIGTIQGPGPEFNFLIKPKQNCTDCVKQESAKDPKSDVAESSVKLPTEQAKEERNQQQQIAQLASQDRQVRTHEAAHKAAGGSLTGAASYTYTKGPDGKQYATGGEVSINTSTVANDPQANLRKANQIRAAALAPANPSNQDRAVAAQASIMASEARSELLKQHIDPSLTKSMDRSNKNENSSPPESSAKTLNPYADEEISSRYIDIFT